MKRSFLPCLASAILFIAPLSSQSSEKLSELISTEKATYGQAAYLSQVYSGEIDENASFDDAVQNLEEQNILKSGTNPEAAISLSELSFICMKTAGLKGGLFYTLFPGPRYALRELKAKGVVPAGKDPSAKVTGREMIAVFNGVLPSEPEDGQK